LQDNAPGFDNDGNVDELALTLNDIEEVIEYLDINQDDNVDAMTPEEIKDEMLYQDDNDNNNDNIQDKEDVMADDDKYSNTNIADIGE
jgi:hypothetical protein